MSAQLTLFSVGVRPPAHADLDGLLAGPGKIVRRGTTARISVLLPDPAQWRVAALLAGLAELGIAGEVVRGEFGTSVRTPFAAELLPTAQRWSTGALTVAPPGLSLDGPALRWWCLAAGCGDASGYVLFLGSDEASWSRIGSALAASGVPGTFVRPRQLAAIRGEPEPPTPRESLDGVPVRGTEVGRRGRPAYRIVGRRLRRLIELVGPAPAGAAVGGWPS